ncbi:MAG: transcriptional regulator [Candidatus Micrarchaeia archaeon]
MVELDPVEQLIVKAMQEIGATKDTSIKTADDIAKKCNRPKGLITNKLVVLAQKGVVKRVAREKAAGYYLVQSA